MKRLLILITFPFLILNIVCSQVETHYCSGNTVIANPFKLGNDVLSKCKKTLPPFDVAELLKEDVEMKEYNAPFRFGKGFDISWGLDDGMWVNVDSGYLWIMSFESIGAYSLNLIFEDFHLPEGGYLYIINSDETVLYGPVKAGAIPENGFFMTDIIAGSGVTINVFEPKDQVGTSTLTIKRVVPGYKKVFVNETNGLIGSSATCNIDVACYPEHEKESGAIALVLLADGTELCSGSLVMSTDYSFDPYFLSAFHCIDTVNAVTGYPDGVLVQKEIEYAQKWMFKFCYKKADCDGSILTSSYTYNGDTFLAAYKETDFALLKLHDDLKRNDNLTWLGWDRTGLTPTGGLCIHHPAGDVMKINVEEDVFQKSSWGGTNQHWYITWDEGITQGGSSGAPLLDQNKHIVGQNHGKLVSQSYLPICDRDRSDFGMFHLSWTGGGTNTSRLSNWLDPNGRNWMIMNSYKYSEFPHHISGPSVVCDSTQYSVLNLPNDMSVTWSINSNRFKVTPYGNQCKVTYDSIPRYDHATLSATIMKDTVTVTTLTKRIVMHGTDMYLEGIQSGIYDENGDMPAEAATFTIPATLASRGGMNRLSTLNRDSIEMSRIPVVFESMRTITIPDNPTYGVTEIYGGADIYLDGERLDGMTISFSGDRAPEYLSTDGGTMLSFRMPEVSSITDVLGYYYVVLHATSEGGCHDFDLYFKVIPVEGESIGDPEISLYFTDSSVRVDFYAMEWEELPNGQIQNIPWYLYIYRMAGYGNPSMTLMHSSTNNTESKTVSISNWPSGIYLVRIDSNGSTYTKKFLKQ